MLKNKNFNFALIVLALTLGFLYAFASYDQSNAYVDEAGTKTKVETKENLVISSN